MSAGAVRLAALALAVLLAAAWFGSLALRPLYKADESRYGEISREMVARDDWVTPRLNGFRYFEKPPLQYWATAAAFELFGVRDWSARLWTGLLALAGVLLSVLAARRLYGPAAGVLAGIVLAGAPLYLLLGQFNTLDMGVSVFMSAAVFAFVLRRPLRFWTACAAAVLSKGLIGIVLPLGAAGLYGLARRDWALPWRMRAATGSALFLILCVPWFAAVAGANPEFVHFFFVQEHFQRFTTHIHHRVEPWWYFFVVLAAGFAPWVLALPGALARGWRDEAGRFLVVWCVLVFVFFSLSGSKLPPYILPIFPALAVLVGRHLVRAPRRLLVAQSVLAAAAGIVLILASHRVTKGFAPDIRALAEAYVPWLRVAGGALAVGGLGGLFYARRGRAVPSAGMVALGCFAALLLALGGTRVLAPIYSVSDTLAQLSAPIPADAEVFAVESYDHTLPWNLHRTVTMVGYKDELEKAIAWDPEHFVPDLAAFAERWRAPGAPKYAIFAARDFPALRERLDLPMAVLARGPRYVIVRTP